MKERQIQDTEKDDVQRIRSIRKGSACEQTEFCVRPFS